MLDATTIDAVLGDRTRVAAALHAAHSYALNDVPAPLLNRVEHRIAQLLGVGDQFQAAAELAGESVADSETDPVTVACVNFAEQWVVDVASMPSSLVDEVRGHLGQRGLGEFVHGLLVVEQRLRLGIAWQRLGLVPAGGLMPPGTIDRQAATCDAPDLKSALAEWQAGVVCLDEVDPVTTELVRLRCATHHDCHT